MSESTYLDLYDLLPDLEVDYEHHHRCERELIGPALEAEGFRLIGSWFTGDGDSFGPLTRCIRTDRGIVVYG